MEPKPIEAGLLYLRPREGGGAELCIGDGGPQGLSVVYRLSDGQLRNLVIDGAIAAFLRTSSAWFHGCDPATGMDELAARRKSTGH